MQIEEIHPSPLATSSTCCTASSACRQTPSEPLGHGRHRDSLYLALVSGVVVLLPSLVKDFFALRVGKNLKRMWLDAHNVVGIISLPFHIVMALTAVVFAYHDQIYDVQDKLVHKGQWAQAFPRPPATPGAPPARDTSALRTPLQLVQTAKAIAPGFEPALLQYQQVTGSRAVVRIWGKDAAAISAPCTRRLIAFDPYSGQVLTTDFLPGHRTLPICSLAASLLCTWLRSVAGWCSGCTFFSGWRGMAFLWRQPAVGGVAPQGPAQGCRHACATT